MHVRYQTAVDIWALNLLMYVNTWLYLKVQTKEKHALTFTISYSKYKVKSQF